MKKYYIGFVLSVVIFLTAYLFFRLSTKDNIRQIDLQEKLMNAVGDTIDLEAITHHDWTIVYIIPAHQDLENDNLMLADKYRKKFDKILAEDGNSLFLFTKNFKITDYALVHSIDFSKLKRQAYGHSSKYSIDEIEGIYYFRAIE